MDATTRAHAGAKALMAGIDARIEELDALGGELMEQFRTHDLAVRTLVRRLEAIQKEMQELEALKRRYQNRSAKAEPTKDAKDDRPGATDAILGLLQAAPN